MSTIKFNFDKTDKGQFRKDVAALLQPHNIDVPNVNSYSWHLVFSRGQLSKAIDLSSYRFDKNNVFKFERHTNTFIFDADKVVAWFAKKEKMEKNATINQNVSTFKWDLLESFIKGKLDEKEIEYTFEKTNTWRTEEIFTIKFEFNNCKITLRIEKPCKSELAKLNFDNVLGTVSVKDHTIQQEIKVIKFIASIDTELFDTIYKDYMNLVSENSSARKVISNQINKLQASLDDLERQHPKTQTEFIKKELKKVGWL